VGKFFFLEVDSSDGLSWVGIRKASARNLSEHYPAKGTAAFAAHDIQS
jgi:hypothetical protein